MKYVRSCPILDIFELLNNKSDYYNKSVLFLHLKRISESIQITDRVTYRLITLVGTGYQAPKPPNCTYTSTRLSILIYHVIGSIMYKNEFNSIWCLPVWQSYQRDFSGIAWSGTLPCPTGIWSYRWPNPFHWQSAKKLLYDYLFGHTHSLKRTVECGLTTHRHFPSACFASL